MTNNLKKEIERIITWRERLVLDDEDSAYRRLLAIANAEKEAIEEMSHLINQKEKEAFYAGQAMAGVTLQRCHESWARWNLPKEEKDRIKTFNPPQEKWLQEYPKQLKEELKGGKD